MTDMIDALGEAFGAGFARRECPQAAHPAADVAHRYGIDCADFADRHGDRVMGYLVEDAFTDGLRAGQAETNHCGKGKPPFTKAEPTERKAWRKGRKLAMTYAVAPAEADRPKAAVPAVGDGGAGRQTQFYAPASALRRAGLA